MIKKEYRGDNNMKCFNCGAEVPEGASFCTYCGQNLNGQPQQPQSQQPQPVQQPIQTTVEENQYYVPGAEYQPAYDANPKPKKSHKALKSFGTVALVIVIVIVASIVTSAKNLEFGKVENGNYINESAELTFNTPKGFKTYVPTADDFSESTTLESDKENGICYEYLYTSDDNKKTTAKAYYEARSEYDDSDNGNAAQIDFVFFDGNSTDPMTSFKDESALNFMNSDESFKDEGYEISNTQKSTKTIGKNDYDCITYTASIGDVKIDCLCGYYQSGQDGLGISIMTVNSNNGYSIDDILADFSE